MRPVVFKTLIGLALCLAATPSFAGPCTEQISEAQAAFDAQLQAKAAAGPAATETTAATLHRQPTPGSVANAEASLGEVSNKKALAFEAAMKRATAADAAGDAKACTAALDEGRMGLTN